MNNDILKLDSKAVEKLNQEILKLKKELAAISLEQGSLCESDNVCGWRTAPESEVFRNDYEIKAARLRELENLKYETISEHHQDGYVDINKTYKLNLEYANGKSLEKTVTLITGMTGNNIFNTTPQISISSPIGQAIAGKQIGSSSTFNSPMGTCIVTILEEINENVNE